MTRMTRPYEAGHRPKEAKLTWKRFLSPPFFLIALLCFFLPFFAVTCSGLGGFPGAEEAEQATEVSGLELVTGAAEDNLADTSDVRPDLGGLLPAAGPTPTPLPLEPPDVGVPQGQEIDLGLSQIWAIAAAAVALLGIFLSLLAGRAGGVVALILGAAGAVLLFLLATEFKSSIVDVAGGGQAESFLKVEKKIGYLIALGAFIVAAVTGLIRLLLPDRPGAAPEAGFEQPAGAPPPPPEAPPA